MKILILSRNELFYSTARLKEAALARGHEVVVTDPMFVSLVVDGDRPGLFLKDRDLSEMDLVIPRIGMVGTDFGVAVVKQLQMMGIAVINNSLSIMRARDKLRCMQILTKHDLHFPRTVMTRNPAEVRGAIHKVGGPPVILKFLQGAQGIGVMLAETEKSARVHLGGVLVHESEFAHPGIRQGIRGAGYSDHRHPGPDAGGHAPKGQARRFRSNIHRGGWGELVDPRPEYVEAAFRAAKVIGLDMGGVDLLESDRGPLLLEVNASPGIEGIEKTTGRDVALDIISLCREQGRAPAREDLFGQYGVPLSAGRGIIAHTRLLGGKRFVEWIMEKILKKAHELGHLLKKNELVQRYQELVGKLEKDEESRTFSMSCSRPPRNTRSRYVMVRPSRWTKRRKLSELQDKAKENELISEFIATQALLHEPPQSGERGHRQSSGGSRRRTRTSSFPMRATRRLFFDDVPPAFMDVKRRAPH